MYETITLKKGDSIMKKLLLLIPATLLALVGCKPEPKAKLPEFNGASTSLTPANSTVTTTDKNNPTTTSTFVDLEIPDSPETYRVEIGAGCYLKTTSGGYQEIILKPGSYIKSVSKYTVDRLVIDYFSKQGENHSVYANNKGTGSKVDSHISEIPATEPDDFGKVLEYPINSNGWMIKNETEFNNPALYYVTICLV